jgi:hypothetical protein
MTFMRKAAWACGVALTVGSLAGCSSASAPDAAGDVGSQTESVRIGRTTQINAVRYVVTGPAGFTASGSFDVRRDREVEGTIPGVPAGGPYTVTLSAASTDRNVTCTGMKTGLTASCPGTGEADEKFIKLTCTRIHQGREWGDKDWRSNGKTFSVGTEISLACAAPDGGAADASPADAAAADASPADAAAEACVPTPLAQACGSNNCGTVDDGCGHKVSCGTCTVPGQCSGNPGTCEPCGASLTSTSCLLSENGPSCLGCAVQNGCLDQGQTCESITTTAQHFPGTLPDGKSCSSVIPSGTSETQVCEETLQAALTTNCASTGSLVPCLCGTTNAATCLGGTATPTGPLYDLFACDSNTLALQNTFTIPNGFDTAIGVLQCAASFGCNCFGGSCTPATSCPAGQTCGTASDNCGGTIPCGTCAAGQVCTGLTCCTPATACPAGQTCGTAPDGCGGALHCGTCTAGTTCSAGGQCVSCTPKTCAAGQCGAMADGCGGTITCGSCAAGQTCGTDNACHSGNPACSATGSTTACLNAQGPTAGACTSCAQANGCLDPAQIGGTCEDTAGTLPHLGGTLPDGNTCTSVFSQGSTETEAQVCLDTLGAIFTSTCASMGTEQPCFCGSTPSATCLAGTAQPNGPSYDATACDFDSTVTSTIVNNFTNQTFGAGQANALVQCLNAFVCPCF